MKGRDYLIARTVYDRQKNQPLNPNETGVLIISSIILFPGIVCLYFGSAEGFAFFFGLMFLVAVILGIYHGLKGD
jgi:hypothetical protein